MFIMNTGILTAKRTGYLVAIYIGQVHDPASHYFILMAINICLFLFPIFKYNAEI